MRRRLLLYEYRPEVVIAGIANTVSNAISRLNMDTIWNVSEEILKELDENDTSMVNMYLIRLLNQMLQDTMDLGISVGECFRNGSKAVYLITFHTMAEVAHSQQF